MTVRQRRDQVADLVMSLCDELGRPVTPREIKDRAAGEGIPACSMRHYLHALTTDGRLEARDGRYWPPLAGPPPLRRVARRVGDYTMMHFARNCDAIDLPATVIAAATAVQALQEIARCDPRMAEPERMVEIARDALDKEIGLRHSRPDGPRPRPQVIAPTPDQQPAEVVIVDTEVPF